MIFLNGSSTKLFATDEGISDDQVTGIDLGALFCLEEGLSSFKVVCQTSGLFSYHIYASGLNTTTTGDVRFSEDRKTWSEDVTLAGLQGGEISDNVFFKLTPRENSVIGATTFLIRVDEELV
jgi:hypothetical protein